MIRSAPIHPTPPSCAAAAGLRAAPRPATAMTIASVARALPPHRYSQDELIDALRALWTARHGNPGRLEAMHRAVQVGSRHLALPIHEYPGLSGFGATNAAFTRVATDVGAEAVRRALDAAGLTPRDVDVIFFTTVTGVAAPSIDARLVNSLGFRPDVKRVPMFGLGCVAGAAGIARMADHLRGAPSEVGVLLSVELCSLTLQREDLSLANVIASGLFGDGAAAVVGLGAARAPASGAAVARRGPRVIASRSRFYPGTEDIMGWEVRDAGFRIILGPGLPALVRERIGADVDAFLAQHNLARKDIATWICHPGGPKVLEAFEEVLGLRREDLALTWRSLNDVGNLSSASVLLVLEDTIAERRPAPGSLGLVLAMGPGFCAEMVLVEW